MCIRRLSAALSLYMVIVRVFGSIQLGGAYYKEAIQIVIVLDL